MDGTIFIADDDSTIRTVLTQAYTRAGCKVHSTASLQTLLRWVEEGKGDLIISDVMMPDGNGLEMVPQITNLRADIPIIIISAQNTIMTAIKANDVKVYDYFPKPFDLPDLMKKSAQALQKRPRQVVDTALQQAHGAIFPLIGRSAVMQALYRALAPVLKTDIAVLLQGESGTGKTLIAQTIHDFSNQQGGPVATLNARQIEGDENLEDIIQGAAQGTLILEDLADYSQNAQALLLRALNAAGQNVPRIVATSQKPISSMIEPQQFRSDLYFRIAGITVDIPPLRDRVGDIEELIAHFIQTTQQNMITNCIGITQDALKQMKKYSWPGNVRQIENCVLQLCLMQGADEINDSAVQMILQSQPMAQQIPNDAKISNLGQAVERSVKRYFDLHGLSLPQSGVYQRVLREVEVPLIEIALDAAGGNQAKCADLLGINRNTLRKKIAMHDIRVTRKRKLL